MGKGSSGGSSPSNPVPTTSQTAPSPIAMQAYDSLLNQAQGVASQPLQQYQGNLVAGFNPTQQAGFNSASNTWAAGQPYTDQAGSLIAGSANPTIGQLPGATQSLMSPYLNSAVSATEQQLQNVNEQQQEQLTGQAIGAGAYGGDRAGVAAGNLANQQDLAAGQTLGTLENQGFQSAQGAALNSLEANAQMQGQAGTELGALGQQNLSNLLTTGGMQQQLEQEQLNIPYEEFAQQQAYPFQTTGWLGNLVEGLGSQMGGTSATQVSGPNPITQVAGLGLAGLGAAGSAGAFSNRGGRISRASGGLTAGQLGSIESLLASGVPDVDTDPVGTPEGSAAHGSGAPNPPSGGGSSSDTGIPNISADEAKALGQAGKSIFGESDDPNQIVGQDEYGNYINSNNQVVTLAQDAPVLPGYSSASASAAIPASTATMDAGIDSGWESLALDAVASGGRIHRGLGGGTSSTSAMATGVPNVGPVSASPVSGASSGGGSLASNMPAPPQMLGDDQISGSDSDDALAALGTAAEIAVMVANRGGRMHKASGGTTQIPQVSPSLLDNSGTGLPQLTSSQGPLITANTADRYSYYPGVQAMDPNQSFIDDLGLSGWQPLAQASLQPDVNPGVGSSTDNTSGSGGGGQRAGGRILRGLGGNTPDAGTVQPYQDPLVSAATTQGEAQAQQAQTPQVMSQQQLDQLAQQDPGAVQALAMSAPPGSSTWTQDVTAQKAAQPSQSAGLMPGASMASLGGVVSPQGAGSGYWGGGLVPRRGFDDGGDVDDIVRDHADAFPDDSPSSWTRSGPPPDAALAVPRGVVPIVPEDEAPRVAHRQPAPPVKTAPFRATNVPLTDVLSRTVVPIDEPKQPVDQAIEDRLPAPKDTRATGRMTSPTGQDPDASIVQSPRAAADALRRSQPGLSLPQGDGPRIRGALLPRPRDSSDIAPIKYGFGDEAPLPDQAPPPRDSTYVEPIKFGFGDEPPLPSEAPRPSLAADAPGPRQAAPGLAAQAAPPAPPPSAAPPSSSNPAKPLPPADPNAPATGQGATRARGPALPSGQRPTASAAPPSASSGSLAPNPAAQPQTAAAQPQSASDRRYKDLMDSLAYKPTPFSKPQHDSNASMWNALMSAGFGMASSRSPQALSALGEGGLRGLQAYNATKAANLTEDQAAEKLHNETEKWNKEFANKQQTLVRQTAADDAKEREANRRVDVQQAREDERRRQDALLAADRERRTDAMFATIGARNDRDTFTALPMVVKDEENPGQTKTVYARFSARTGEMTPLDAAYAPKSGSTGRLPSEAQLIEYYVKNGIAASRPEAQEMIRTRSYSPEAQNRAIAAARREIDAQPENMSLSESEREQKAKQLHADRMNYINSLPRAGAAPGSAPTASVATPIGTAKNPLVPKTQNEIDDAPPGTYIRKPDGTVLVK